MRYSDLKKDLQDIIIITCKPEKYLYNGTHQDEIQIPNRSKEMSVITKLAKQAPHNAANDNPFALIGKSLLWRGSRLRRIMQTHMHTRIKHGYSDQMATQRDRLCIYTSL